MAEATKFATEAEMCSAFIETLPSAWTSYNETGGFDMLLVHEGGFQIGVEAKLALNVKVVSQAADLGYRAGVLSGPDARAVLVPKLGGQADALKQICKALGITVVVMERTSHWDVQKQGPWSPRPALPEPENICGVDGEIATSVPAYGVDRDWYDLVPIERAYVPEYVPDVEAGHPSPVVLGRWKIQSIKICFWVKRFGSIRREHFRALGVDPGRWMTGVWLKKGAVRGEWVAGDGFPFDGFKRCHPSIVAAIEADFDTWVVSSGLAALPPVSGAVAAKQEALL